MRAYLEQPSAPQVAGTQSNMNAYTVPLGGGHDARYSNGALRFDRLFEED